MCTMSALCPEIQLGSPLRNLLCRVQNKRQPECWESFRGAPVLIYRHGLHTRLASKERPHSCTAAISCSCSCPCSVAVPRSPCRYGYGSGSCGSPDQAGRVRQDPRSHRRAAEASAGRIACSVCVLVQRKRRDECSCKNKLKHIIL